MSFEVQGDKEESSNNTTDPQRDAGSVGEAITPGDIKITLRAKQAALEVVLDNVSLMSAQARLTRCVDPEWWTQVFQILDIEIAKLRTQLLEGASFEEIVYAAEEAGESITRLAERLGVDIEKIAHLFNHSDHVTL